jgi:hypothetical protein
MKNEKKKGKRKGTRSKSNSLGDLFKVQSETDTKRKMESQNVLDTGCGRHCKKK